MSTPANPTPIAAPLDLDAPRVGAAVCGVDCHPGDGRCNGYCTDARVKLPPTITLPAPVDSAREQLARGAEGNGANLNAAECAALLASVRGAEAETRDAERYRFLRDNPLQLRAIDGNANICGSIKAESVDQWTDIAMLDAARAHPPIQETDADA